MTESTSSPEDLLAAAIAETGAVHGFGVPGGGANLDMVGALGRHGIQFVLTHSETAACIAASTYGYVSDTVTAAVVTRGPGAASAVNGAAQATLDRHPLVLVCDTVAANQHDRIAHQRIDQPALFAPVTKASGVLNHTTAADAVALAAATPRGAVHLDQDTSDPPRLLERPSTPGSLTAQSDDLARIDEARAMLAGADHPVVIVGVDAPPTSGLASTLQRFGAPVLTTYQAVGAIPTGSSIDAGLFTGGRPEWDLLARADLVVLVGLDMVEPIPSDWPSDAPVLSLAGAPTVETYAPIALELIGDIEELAAATLTTAHRWPPSSASDHRTATIAELRSHGREGFGPIDVVDGAAAWAQSLDGLTTTVDAGAHFLAVMPLWRVRQRQRLLISNGLATMGYAVPAAIGAALARPGEPVLAFTGDGGLGMCLAELETIARLDLPITVIVFNDAALSLIRIKQKADHGGDQAVVYRPANFATIADGLGMPGVRVSSADGLADALQAPSTGPRLLDVQIDPSSYGHLIRATRG